MLMKIDKELFKANSTFSELRYEHILGVNQDRDALRHGHSMSESRARNGDGVTYLSGDSSTTVRAREAWRRRHWGFVQECPGGEPRSASRRCKSLRSRHGPPSRRPRPGRSIVRESHSVASASLRTMFRALQRAQERDYRGQIAAACFNHALRSGDVSLVLYDVTTLYFEAENEDELRKVGYSKERRVDPQIVVGLLVDRRGFPLEIGCFEGNKAETLTIIPIVKQFAKRHGIADMVVVADAGMLSASNLRDLDEAGLRFVVGSRVTKAPKDLESHFRWHGTAFTDGQVIDTITPRDQRGTAVKSSDPMVKAEPVWDPAVHAKSWRAVWAYSTKRAVRDNKTLTLQENKARAVVAGEKTARTPRFVKSRNGATEVDETSLARARGLVGLKGYVTNIEASLMPAGEVIASYHDLWHVEQSFRMSKTDLAARPMFHHTREAIEAHLTIVFAALAIARHLQDATGLSIKKIVQTLRPIQQITVRIAGHEHIAADPLTPTARAILDALRINPQ